MKLNFEKTDETINIRKYYIQKTVLMKICI